MKKYLFITLLISSSFLYAQEDPERIPRYEVPYEYPTVQGVRETLDRVTSYYKSSSEQVIVDGVKGAPITNFKRFNPKCCAI